MLVISEFRPKNIMIIDFWAKKYLIAVWLANSMEKANLPRTDASRPVLFFTDY